MVVKKILILLAFAIFSVDAFSQENTSYYDSLNHLINTAPDDSTRLNYMLKVATHLRDIQQIDSSYIVTKGVLKIAKEKDIPFYVAQAYQILGALCHIKSDYDSALHFDLQALKMFEELSDSSRIDQLLNNIGEDYFAREFYSMAYDYYYKSYQEALKQKDSLSMTIATYNMGRVLKEQGHYESALAKINESLEMSERIGDTEGLAYANYDLGDIFFLINETDEALSKLQTALEISEQESTFILIPQIYNKLGEIYELKKDYQNAIANFQNALKHNERMNNKLGVAQNYRGIGSVYFELGNYTEAENLFEKGLGLATNVGSLELTSACYRDLSELFEKRGEVNKAFQYFKRYKIAEDSLLNFKKGEQLAQLQMEHVLQQNDLEIQLLNQREAQQQSMIKRQELIRDVLVVLIAFFMVLLITLYRSSVRRKKLNKILINQQYELEQQQVELKELNKVKDKFFSIISHDLRSPINNLAGMSSLINSGNIAPEEVMMLNKSIKKQLDHASKLLDNLMDWVLLQSNEIKIKKEEVHLQSLVQENIDFFTDLNEKKLSIINNVDDVVVMADRNMVDLVVRNLLSNAIKFTEEGGKISISNERIKNQEVVFVEDNGIGVPEEVKGQLFDFKSHYSRKGTANEKGTGLGLKLCKEFVERNGGKIWVESEEGKGSTFKFTLERAEQL